ncbi:MAG: hypothetical protein MJ113_01505 [Lachnospiraceae bacterium]|nr:hypothetical protein [Lachnospiraceae bacterium]
MNNLFLHDELNNKYGANLPSFIPLAYDVLARINAKTEELKKLQTLKRR